MSELVEEAKEEIHKSLILSSFCMSRVGLSFISPKTKSDFWKQKAMFVISMSSICYHVFGDIVYIALTLSDSPRVEDVVPLLHTFGYGALSKYHHFFMSMRNYWLFLCVRKLRNVLLAYEKESYQ